MSFTFTLFLSHSLAHKTDSVMFVIDNSLYLLYAAFYNVKHVKQPHKHTHSDAKIQQFFLNGGSL